MDAEQSTSLVSLLCITRIQMYGFGGGFPSEAITIGVSGVRGLPIRPRSLDGLSDAERTVVWQAINVEHECLFCVPAHTIMAK